MNIDLTRSPGLSPFYFFFPSSRHVDIDLRYSLSSGITDQLKKVITLMF
jgi:hypothetical protein